MEPASLPGRGEEFELEDILEGKREGICRRDVHSRRKGEKKKARKSREKGNVRTGGRMGRMGRERTGVEGG